MSTKGSNFRYYLILGLIIALFGLFCAISFGFIIDDAYITLRYAKNLAFHGQLAFNPGEPSEGYTNLSLVVLEALLFKLGLSGEAVLNGAKVICIGSGALTLWVVTKIFQLFIPNKDFSLLPALFLGLSTPFIFWSVGGLETTLFTCFVTLGTYAHLRSVQRSEVRFFALTDLAFLAAALTRPEGVGFWAIALAHGLYCGLTQDRKVDVRRVATAVVALLVLALYLVWKQRYFGFILPLTYYAKEQSLSLGLLVKGVIKLSTFLKVNSHQLHFAFALFAAVYFWKDKRIGFFLASLALFLLYLVTRGYSVAMDDIYRLFVPIIPLLYLLSSLGMYRLFEKCRDLARIPVMVAGILLVGTVSVAGAADFVTVKESDMNFGIYRYRFSADDVTAGLNDAHISVGKWLAAHAPQDAKLLMHDVGAVPYYSNLYTIDAWSLVSPEIVMRKKAIHAAKGEERTRLQQELKDYVFALGPDVVVQDSDLGFRADPRFLKNYRKIDKTFYYDTDYPLEIWVKNGLVLRN